MPYLRLTHYVVQYKSLNFSVECNSLPKEDVISLVVSSVRTLSEVDVHFIRFETAKSLSLRKGCSTEFA